MAYTRRLRSCRLTGGIIISPLPLVLTTESCTAGSLCSTGVTPLRCYYGPSRHRLVFGRFPGFAGYTTYLAPPISRRDEDGFSSCLACPCRRAAPTTPPERRIASVRLRHVMRPSPHPKGLGLRGLFLVEATCGFTCVAARRLAHHPEDGFVDQLHQIRFLH